VGEDNRPELTGEKSAKKLADFLNELPKLDAIVTVAYGKIIPPALLYYVPAGVINIHPSLIPRWRGAAPLQYAIYSGDSETGVALMLAEEGLDTGPVFLTEHYPISDDTTLGDLHDALCEKGASLLMSQLENILTGKLLPKQQDETQATYADKWTSEDAAICWDEPGTVTQRRVRASSPVPGARTWQGEALIKIYRARLVAPAGSSTLAAGQLIDWPDTHLAVVCGDGAILSVEEAQLPGKKRMPVEDLLRGHTFTPDTIFKKLI
jgi:methionyl-tRNA formyltransferase